MFIRNPNFQYMPFFLQLLTGHALAGFLIFLFAVWNVISGNPVLPHMFMAFCGLYSWVCGMLFLRRWKYAREAYLGIYFIGEILMLVTGSRLFLFFVMLFTMTLPIAWYLYKNESVSNYFALSR